MEPAAYVTEQLKSGELKFAVEDPDAPENWPRVLTLWRANLLGSSSKGNEYFLKHLLGTSHAVRADEAPEDQRPAGRHVARRRPGGQARPAGEHRLPDDLVGRCFGDVLLPAATWYEKYDLSSTDMHPFVHAFTPAIDPPWETKSDYDIFRRARPRRLPPGQGRAGHAHRPGDCAAAARHPGRVGPARWASCVTGRPARST